MRGEACTASAIWNSWTAFTCSGLTRSLSQPLMVASVVLAARDRDAGVNRRRSIASRKRWPNVSPI